MAGRKRKRLVDIVRDGTFRAREDERLLGGKAKLPWPELEKYRRRFLATAPADRRKVALELQDEIGDLDAQTRLLGDLQVELLKLGPAGSYEQLAAFTPKYFKHFAGPRAGKRFRFDPFQEEFLREFWRRDGRGRRVYTSGLLGIAKGNGKTPLTAVLGTHTLVAQTDQPEVYSVAGAKDQAAHCFDFASRNITEGALAAWLSAHSGAILCLDHFGEFEILSSDGDIAQGVKPSAALMDELSKFVHRKQREAYAAQARALHKRPDAFLLAITNAGFDKHTLLGETFDRAVEHPKLEVHNDGFLLVLRDEKAGFLMHWYGLPEGAEDADIENPKLVRACNPAPWVKPRALIRDLHKADTDELDWRRLHLNQWTKTREAWLPTGCWAGLRDAKACAEVPPGAGVWVGVDAALHLDTTAVVWAWKLPDERVALRAHVWATDLGLRAAHHTHVPGNTMRFELVEDFIRELNGRHGVHELLYDPRYFHESAARLAGDGIQPVELVQSSAPMADALDDFYLASRRGTIAHDGDRVFAAHVAATGADKVIRGTQEVWKVRQAGGKIDAAVAAVMAHAGALAGRAGGGAPQILWLDGE